MSVLRGHCRKLETLDADRTFRKMENNEINVDLAQSKAFGTRLEKAKDAIIFSNIKAPIRHTLEVQFADNNVGNNNDPIRYLYF